MNESAEVHKMQYEVVSLHYIIPKWKYNTFFHKLVTGMVMIKLSI